VRNISFFLTQEQILNQTKTVTRRGGPGKPAWQKLKVGDRLQPVLKGQGLKSGEKIVYLGPPIEVVSVRDEYLSWADRNEAKLEGFPEMSGYQFQLFYMKQYPGMSRIDKVRRIEFKYQTMDEVEATIDKGAK
jgi:hypothetical protein